MCFLRKERNIIKYEADENKFCYNMAKEILEQIQVQIEFASYWMTTT
jgi:hypothetical protein